MPQQQLNSDQEAAVHAVFAFLNDKSATEFVIEGSAGTGKTTLVQHILNQIPKQELIMSALGEPGFGFIDIYVTATTRKAATVIAEKLTVGAEPLTIHSLLGLKVSNDVKTGLTTLRRTKNDLVTDSLIIIDEASFIDHTLLASIRQLTHSSKVIYIGDPYQLTPPTSGTSPVFGGAIPTAKLTQIMRFDGEIDILSGLYRKTVKSQQFPFIPYDYCGAQVRSVDGPTFQSLVQDSFSLPYYEQEDDAKVLAWTNARVLEYNGFIRQHKGYNHDFEVGEQIVTNKPIMDNKGKTIYATDGRARITYISASSSTYLGISGKYLTLDNKVEVFIANSSHDVKTKLSQLKRQKKWSDFFTTQDSIADIRPPYACTVHKSQGSTYKRVLIDLNDIGRCNVPDQVARMLYVAISRASEEVILYGKLPEKYQGEEYGTQAQSPHNHTSAA
jgi:nucleoside-triphosphatase THEP1|tara:strand:- start:2112 stop:3443 length:1332 start_codon:yes stop_codon:yes gene_type:complete